MPLKQRRRNVRSAVSAAILWLTVSAFVTFAILWQMRIAVMTRVVRGALDRQGLTDAAFTLRQVTPGHVVVEDIRLGKPMPVLAIDQVDVLFSCQELLRHHVERLTVRGVRTQLTVDGGKMSSPLYERMKPLVAAWSAHPPEAGTVRFSLGAGALQDAQVRVVPAGGGVLTTLTFEAGTLSESAGHYRVWGNLHDDGGVQLRAEGVVDADTGAVALTPEVKIGSVEKLLALASRVAPEQAARLPAFPTNCVLILRGAVAVQDWTNFGPFEINAELGRGSTWVFPAADAFVRFQSFRVEASGTPRDLQCRVSAGVSGFRIGGQVQTAQEEGRLLSLRASARFRQTATNQWVTATLDSDLPGRSAAQVLPRLLPLVRVFFSEGGTLHMETEVTRQPEGLWQGTVRFKAEALRFSVPLAAGRVGAGAMRVAGAVEIVESKPGVVQTELQLVDGYFFRRNLSLRGGVEANLTARPPYPSASGVFKGRVSESVALPERNLSVKDGVVPFEGEAVVTGLTSNPVWQVALRVPEFVVVSTQQTVDVRATVGAKAAVRYSATNMAVEGDAWVRDGAVQVGPASNRVGEAGVGRIAAHVNVPSFNPALASNALVGVTLSVSNGWARAGTLAVVEDVRGSVPLTWSLAKGLSFLPEQSLTWQRLEAQGLKVEPDFFALAASGNVVEARLGARGAGSKLRVALTASVPLGDPQQTTLDVALPETEIAADDAVALWARGKLKDTEITGCVAAEAKVRFLGSHPHVVGRVRVTEGRVRSGKVEVDGLAADVPFESGVSFRTIERPSVSFRRATAGNVRLDQGRLAFQFTPRELFVDRLEVGWCKGSLNAYSVHLDLKNPKDDFIVYADRIDFGEALMMVLPFKGMMQGVLYGRFPVGFDNWHVKLSTGFLYSLPGQGGKLKLDDDTQMATLLGKAGIKGEVQAPLAKALSNMDFSTFKMDLEPGQGDEGTLRIKLAGKSNDKTWPAPVDLNLNLHGPLEELLNMGLDLSRK